MNWVWAVKRNRIFDLNLHIHTVLSPCADLNMTPGLIIERALEEELDIIAITDHNSAGNLEVLLKLADGEKLRVIPGLEIETREEVHYLCLVEKLEQAVRIQNFVHEQLPEQKNREEYFGYQIKTNLKDEYEEKEKLMLAAAADITISELQDRVKKENGLLIPSHVLRSQGLIYQLGFIPPQLDLPVLEVNDRSEIPELRQQYPDRVFIKNQDSHRPREIKKGFSLKMEDPGFKSLKKALTSQRQSNIILPPSK
ncbi:PHP domain-containing protein [Halarsenatibacter silvermanii]|uniref:Polymerase/histidinol phosphatase N-terminal domain-containing protein n=1 Tax=Halarsenatibacter silvermanii TaxID=321763 RepID=A0A1G9QMB6_9FIRM|nr:PHP domain-containing protein [Halarsenatibacter silvermanii]SDM12133.1 hypothetical protein SAMN04488692_11735 [Halarsenatibacter silvermanii]